MLTKVTQIVTAAARRDLQSYVHRSTNESWLHTKNCQSDLLYRSKSSAENSRQASWASAYL